MSVTSGNNFISGMGVIANSNLLVQKFDKAASVVKNSGSVEEQKKAVQEFEAQFISQLMKMMFNTVKTDENFGGGFAEDSYKDMLTDEYGSLISKKGGIGLAADLQKSIFDFNNVDNQASKIIEASKAYNKIYNF